MEGQSWISRIKEIEEKKQKAYHLYIGGQVTTQAAKKEKEGQDNLNNTVE